MSPSLFGLKSTNRNFHEKDSWGKNQFNSSFPTALACYMFYKKIELNYLSIHNNIFTNTVVAVDKVFNISPEDLDIFFAFETQYTPYQKYVFGTLPRTDLVIQKKSTGECLAALEIKLTALPDNATCNLLEEKNYGCEIVIRPDTIAYLACSITESLSLKTINKNILIDFQIEDWGNEKSIIAFLPDINRIIKELSILIQEYEIPFLLQPIWKTKGKSPELCDDCLDIFTWSNAAFLYFIVSLCKDDIQTNNITRPQRSIVWLYKMLLEINKNEQFDYKSIIDKLSYNTKNDKAFACSGTITNKFMISERLQKPIIKKHEIKNIILGGGQTLLSPERRFDAIVFNSVGLF